MQRDFLGDAPDYWKGALLLSLKKSVDLQHFYAIPMFTDAAEWSPELLKSYARCLQLLDDKGEPDVDLIYSAPFPDAPGRDEYFATAEMKAKDRHAQVVFLDPNAGIRTSLPSSCKKNYILVGEFRHLLADNTQRILMVYDETRNHQDPKDEHVEGIGKDIQNGGYDWCAYEAGRNLTMFFVASDKSDSFSRVKKALRVFLGACAEGDHRPREHAGNRFFEAHGQQSIG